MNEKEDSDYYDSDCSASTTYSEFVGESPKKKYKCTFDKCEKSFYRPSKLEIHERTHTGKKPFKCENPDCDKAFHRIELLRKHQNEVHLKKIEYTECPEDGCGMKLRLSSLRKHLLRKHNELRKWTFQCAICNGGFRTKNELANHLTEHSILFKCKYCGKQFKKNSLYQKHLKCHVERECECGLKFYEHAMLLAHRKNCTFSKPTCEICKKKFSNTSNLKDHVKHIHNEKGTLFKCEYEGCTRQYTQKKNLVLHMKKSHIKKEDEEAPKFTCTVCNLNLKSNQYLWRHIKRMHLSMNEKIKKPRKPRCDKNKHKVPMLTILTGIEHKEPPKVLKPDTLFITIKQDNGEDIESKTSKEITS